MRRNASSEVPLCWNRPRPSRMTCLLTSRDVTCLTPVSCVVLHRSVGNVCSLTSALAVTRNRKVVWCVMASDGCVLFLCCRAFSCQFLSCLVLSVFFCFLLLFLSFVVSSNSSTKNGRSPVVTTLLESPVTAVRRSVSGAIGSYFDRPKCRGYGDRGEAPGIASTLVTFSVFLQSP